MGRRGQRGRWAPVAALGAIAALVSCDNLAPEVTGVIARDDGAGPIVVGHYASMTGSSSRTRTWRSDKIRKAYLGVH